MGYDISYHPISLEEMKEWYFDRLPEVEKEDFSGMEELGKRNGVDDFYIHKYIDTMMVAVNTGDKESFEKTHAYYLAVVQGFFATYYYTRGTGFTFLVEEQPEMKRFLSSWEEIKPESIRCPVADALVENYSGGVYIGAAQVRELLDYCDKKDEVYRVLVKFFEQNFPVFLKALRDAAEHHKGLLEASEVVEPQPLDLSQTVSYSNLMNCNQEGVLIYQQTAMGQIREFAEQKGLDVEYVIQNAAFEKHTTEKEITAPKKGFWKRLFGR